jgi:hypothetical protein
MRSRVRTRTHGSVGRRELFRLPLTRLGGRLEPFVYARHGRDLWGASPLYVNPGTVEMTEP